MEKAIDKIGVKIGMWIFLYSEIILFGGLFVLYAVYFHNFLTISPPAARNSIASSAQ